MCSMHTQAEEHHLTHAPGTKKNLIRVETLVPVSLEH